VVPPSRVRSADTCSSVGCAAGMVSPDTELAILADEPDDRVLECAVTGDKVMLALGEYEGVEIGKIIGCRSVGYP